ncbi:uncharacterized protein TNCT_632991 [Trichonephila clavata]|uniref:Uncharacterized protein n=1 Tax=Trichonephila clavata TaxID=2740835 RepID=A0A8X6G609_TRICU|nr:uncharacterized protein TNCT_632991 [Trichonephila clavata]
MVFHHHRPLTNMYGDNYRYGTSLYSDAERSYRSSLSKTHVRSDRGDLGMLTFAGSNVHGGTPAAEKIQGTKVSRPLNTDLYAPLNTREYGKGYYDNLRAASPPPRSRSKAADLYEPFNPYEYHPGYYDHLRAPSPERKAKSRPIPYYDLLDADYVTGPAKISSDYSYDSSVKKSSTDYSYDYDSGKKTTTKKTVTTTDYWVPLTTHFYHTPYHTYIYKATPFSSYTYRTADDLYSYNYVDDYKRYATTTKTTRNIDALDLSVSKSYDKTDYSQYTLKW